MTTLLGFWALLLFIGIETGLTKKQWRPFWLFATLPLTLLALLFLIGVLS